MRSLGITDLTGDAPRPIRQLSGPSLGRLSEAAKHRLLAVSLEQPRRSALGLRADAESLILYLSTTLPLSTAVTVLPEFGIGVIGRDGGSLAYVAGRGPNGRRTVTSSAAHGDADAETRLAAAVRDWDALGRPGTERLLVEVAYDGAEPRLRSCWLRR